MESPWKGLSDMDVARATMGQGWPFVACPCNGDGAREPRRSRAGAPSSDVGVCFFAYFLCTSNESESPVRGETHQTRRRANGECQVIDS